MGQHQGLVYCRKLSDVTTMVFEVTKPTDEEALSKQKFKEMPQTEATGECWLSRSHSYLVPTPGECWAGPWEHRGDHDRPGPVTLSASCLLRKQFRPHKRDAPP